MDRRSFIDQDFLNNAGTNNNCLPDDCECEIIVMTGKQNLKETSGHQFAIIAIMAFVCAIVLSIVTTEAAKTNVTELILIKEKGVSCTPGYANRKKLNNHKPDGNNQNNCTHQQGSLCESRRRYTC
jgi:hypothetical protein